MSVLGVLYNVIMIGFCLSLTWLKSSKPT